MAGYPIQLEIEDMPCAVIGGGSVALRKVRPLVKAGARVTVISPVLADGLAELAEAGSIRHIARGYVAGDADGYELVICATDDGDINRQAAKEARALGALVNVIDAPEEGNFTVPSSVDISPLLLTVSTGGISPAFSRMMRQELTETYGAVHGAFLAKLGVWRDEVKDILPTPQAREAFWRSVLTRDVMKLLREGNLDKAEESIQDAISSIRTES